MRKRPASTESIANLINSSQQSIRNYEQLLHDVEEAKAILQATPDSNKSSLEFLQLTFEILSGGTAGMHECTIGLCRILQASNVYEKRYHMQTINLNQFEWCKYLLGKDESGVFAQYCNLFSECTDNETLTYIHDIRDSIRSLGAKCNSKLRNITAHYDNPLNIYQELILLNSEDEYVQRLSTQMEIYDKIILFVRPIFNVIKSRIPSEKAIPNHKSVPEMDLQAIINNQIANALHKNELQKTIDKQLSTAWNEIEHLGKDYHLCQKTIEFFQRKNIDSSIVQNMLSLLEFQWAVTFMRSDLTCAMNSYLNASTMLDGSVCLHRIYMIETAALTHLYGYKEEYRQKSIWYKIKKIAEFTAIPDSTRIEYRLSEHTAILNCNRRNLYTHYWENGSSNISKRWQDFQTMDHVKELYRLQDLILLCKDICSYTASLLSEIDKSQKKRSAETTRQINEMICKIKDMGVKFNNQDIINSAEKLHAILSNRWLK